VLETGEEFQLRRMKSEIKCELILLDEKLAMKKSKQRKQLAKKLEQSLIRMEARRIKENAIREARRERSTTKKRRSTKKRKSTTTVPNKSTNLDAAASSTSHKKRKVIQNEVESQGWPLTDTVSTVEDEILLDEDVLVNHPLLQTNLQGLPADLELTREFCEFVDW
jgi:activator of HSP90 ATPase